METKHTVWVRLQIEAESKEDAEAIATRLMEYAQDMWAPLDGDKLKYWSLKK